MVQYFELSLVIAYLLFLILVGLYLSAKSDSEEDYWIAGGSIGLTANSISMFAAASGGGAFLGMMGLAFAYGIPFTWTVAAGSILGVALGAFLIGRKVREVEGVFTLPDILTAIFPRDSVRACSGAVVGIGMFIYAVATLTAGGIVSQYLLGIDYATGVTIAGVTILIYTTLGGMWSVTVTDIIQGTTMLVISVIVVAAAIFSYGTEPITTTSVMDFAPLPLRSYVGVFLVWAFGVPTFAHLIMRAFSSDSPATSERSFAWAGLMYSCVIFTGTLFVGAAALMIDPELANPDLAIIVFMENALPDMVAGIIAAGILAAVMSTMDSMLLVVTSSVVNDIYKNLFRPDVSEKHIMRMSSIVTIGVGGLIVYLARDPPALVLELSSHATGVMAAGLFIPLVLGLWWKPATSQGALAGLVLGPLAYGISYPYVASYVPIIIAIPASLVAVVTVSLLTTDESRIIDNKGTVSED